MRDNVKGGALTEVTFYILLALFSPRHGYAIMQFIEERTGGRLALGAGTLYGALTTLEEKGWIERCGGDAERKKEYRITTAGEDVCHRELERLRQLLCDGETIMGGRNND